MSLGDWKTDELIEFKGELEEALMLHQPVDEGHEARVTVSLVAIEEELCSRLGGLAIELGDTDMAGPTDDPEVVEVVG